MGNQNIGNQQISNQLLPLKFIWPNCFAKYSAFSLITSSSRGMFWVLGCNLHHKALLCIGKIACFFAIFASSCPQTSVSFLNSWQCAVWNSKFLCNFLFLIFFPNFINDLFLYFDVKSIKFLFVSHFELKTQGEKISPTNALIFSEITKKETFQDVTWAFAWFFHPL